LCVGVILFCFSHAETMRGFYFAVDFSELWRTAGSKPLGVLVGSVVWQWSSASPGCPEFLLKGAIGTSCRASTNLQQPNRTDGRTDARIKRLLRKGITHFCSQILKIFFTLSLSLSLSLRVFAFFVDQVVGRPLFLHIVGEINIFCFQKL
jgi:hypothetical protein